MKGNEILSKSKYFELVKGQHRKQKNNKIHYKIKCQTRYHLPYEDSLDDDDFARIRKIADPNRNRNPNQKKFEWVYKNHEIATKIFMMLMLSGY